MQTAGPMLYTGFAIFVSACDSVPPGVHRFAPATISQTTMQLYTPAKKT